VGAAVFESDDERESRAAADEINYLWRRRARTGEMRKKPPSAGIVSAAAEKRF
jgi:hypothetical protein